MNFDFLFKFHFYFEDIWIPPQNLSIICHLLVMHVLLTVPQSTRSCVIRKFSTFTLAQSNVHSISGPIDLIKGPGRATIIIPKGTKFQIEDALYSNKSSRNLLSFKDIRRNGYHIETMNHDENEYLFITSIISGQKCILEQLPSLSCGLYQTTIRSIEFYAVMNQKFNDSNAFLL